MHPVVDVFKARRRAAAFALGIVATLLASCATDAARAAGADELAQTCGLDDFAASALLRINQLRAAGASCGSRGAFAPVPPLRWNRLLAQAAARHAGGMAASDTLSHTGADGSSLVGRIAAAGYAWRNLGENIAEGFDTVEAVIDDWAGDADHCANLMSPAFDEAGLACVAGAGDVRYWTLDLARPR